MPFKDGDYVPAKWDFDNTQQAVVLSQKEMKALRDELNQEYLRRWSGYVSGVDNWKNSSYMPSNPTVESNRFTDSDGKHQYRLPSWDGVLQTPPNQDKISSGHYGAIADGNIQDSYWSGQGYHKDFRGCPVWYSPLDRYIDGVITYNRNSNQAPTVVSGYKGPDAGHTFPLGTSEWRNSEQYQPHGVSDVTKDRAFKHLIDGLANIVDIDKYFGTGIQEDKNPVNKGDHVVPYNPVMYNKIPDPNHPGQYIDQNPYNSERTNHTYRQTGLATNTNTPGNPATTDKPGTIKDWINILKNEKRNQCYIRACNYQHWIWYFVNESYTYAWHYHESGGVSGSEPEPQSFEYPDAGGSPGTSYTTSERTAKKRVNYNPAYYGHRESYTSCQQACSGFCSQTCYHVCDEQCVYLCDDSCGYSCMSKGQYFACGSVCIANCTDNCGGPPIEGGSGTNPCQNSCTGSTGSMPDTCEKQCAGDCSGFVKDRQACGSSCDGYCSPGCSDLCIQGCKYCCVEDCNISCTISCSEDGEPGNTGEKQGCSVAQCKVNCDTAAAMGGGGKGEAGGKGEGGGVGGLRNPSTGAASVLSVNTGDYNIEGR